MKVTALCLLVLISVAHAVNDGVSANLGTYNVDLSRTTVSGISAGAFMAVQFHIAYSKTVKGVGSVAGGPYLCALGSMTTALTSCMTVPTGINVNKLVSKTEDLGTDIDATSNLAGSKVYIYAGTKDTVVNPQVSVKEESFYENYNANITTVYNIPSQHAWITNDYGNKCSYKGSPYMNNCDYNQAQAVLEWLYGPLKAGVPQVSANLIEFDQSEYRTRGDSLGDTGYVYVPTSCQNKEQCIVHVAFHGCQMTLADIGTDFVENTGLNEIAEANNIIVLYPQAKKSLLSPNNPQGCFDWWGYTSTITPVFSSLKYATQKGVQMQAIWNMIQTLAGQGFESMYPSLTLEDRMEEQQNNSHNDHNHKHIREQ